VPPRKKTAAAGPPKLTHDDIAALKPRVQAGETPRVVVRAASAAVPAGTRGNIVRIGNPSEGEYVVVRLGRDEVPFAPSELGMTARTAAATAAGAPPAGRKATAAKASAPPKKAAPARTPAKAPAKAAANTATEAPAKTTPAPAKATGAAAKSPTKAVKAPAKRTGKTTGGRSRRALPALVVTLRFNDGGWTVEASRGARRLARSSPVRPGAVKAFADLVDEPTVAEAITETIESCRSVVEERAASLRAELVAAEAALKEYESRRR
jgi:hypothetical protein